MLGGGEILDDLVFFNFPSKADLVANRQELLQPLMTCRSACCCSVCNHWHKSEWWWIVDPEKNELISGNLALPASKSALPGRNSSSCQAVAFLLL